MITPQVQFQLPKLRQVLTKNIEIKYNFDQRSLDPQSFLNSSILRSSSRTYRNEKQNKYFSHENSPNSVYAEKKIKINSSGYIGGRGSSFRVKKLVEEDTSANNEENSTNNELFYVMNDKKFKIKSPNFIKAEINKGFSGYNVSKLHRSRNSIKKKIIFN